MFGAYDRLKSVAPIGGAGGVEGFWGLMIVVFKGERCEESLQIPLGMRSGRVAVYLPLSTMHEQQANKV